MPHNFIGLDIQHDNFRKGIFIDPYDEPTFLTFALDFRFEDTPTMAAHDELNLYNSPLLSSGKHSAIQFLINRGYQAQANGLKLFSDMLRHLTFNAPWYFQSITGLEEMYQKATDVSQGYKTKKIELEVETLEAVDLRMAELAGLYRNSVFDLKYRRERVPDNLRWFSVDIYIAEFRNLRFKIPGVGQSAAQVLGINTAALGNIVGGGNIVSNVMDQFGYMKFTCRQCEFDFSDSVPFQKKIEIGRKAGTAESNRFKIKVGWVDEEVKYGDGTKIYDDLTKTDIKNPWGIRNIGAELENAGEFLSGLPIIGESIQQAGQKAMNALSKVGGLVNPALEAASNFLDNPVTQRTLGQISPYGYASNNDIVPTRQKPPTGKAN
jgi:hypothetical protein